MGHDGRIGRVLRVIGVGALVAASVAGCAGGADEGEDAAPTDGGAEARPDAGPGVGVVEPSTTAAPPTTAVPPAAGDPEPPVGVRFERPGDAVAHLHQAWRDGDRAAAAVAADPAAVDTLFAQPSSSPGFTGNECRDEGAGTHRCFMDGESESLVLDVTGGDADGYRVTSASFVALPATDDGAPSVVASPAQVAVGATTHIEGDGFLGDPWTAGGATLYLVGGGDGCALYAVAEHDVEVDGDGHLAGDVVIPAVGDCRMTDVQAPVSPGRYQLAYACTACFIGEIEVLP